MNFANTRKKAVSLLLILAMLTVLVAALVPFVSTADGDEIQNFGYQAPKSYSMIDAESNLRFVFTIGKLDYTQVGFVFSKTDATPSIEEGCATHPATTVYRSITADGETIDAPDGRLWVAVKLTEIPRSYFDGTVYVRAFVTDGNGTRYSDPASISVWEAHPAIEYHSNWDYATRNGNEYSIQNPDYKENNDYLTFGVKEDVRKLYNDKTSVRYFPNENNNYAGNDLLIEFSFLYNDTMSNASDGTLTVMYIENNNVFNINLKTGTISNNTRDGDVVLYKADESGNVSIGGYGWHRFGVRVHEKPINNNGVEDYQIIATAYLDGEKILEVDKTAYAKTKTSGCTGKLYELIPYTNRMIYDKTSKDCDAYVMIEKIYKSSANAGYLVLQDLSFSCGQTFKQQVTKVADPVSQTYKTSDGNTLTAKVYFAAAAAHEHVWDGEFTVTKQPTMFEDGWKAEHCSVCGAGRSVAVTPSDMVPVAFNGHDDASAPDGWRSNVTTVIAKGLSFKFLADDNGHFYPTDGNDQGNDLLVEFSVLWNSTLSTSSWGNHTLDLGLFSGAGSGKNQTTIYLYGKNGQLELNDGTGEGGIIKYPDPFSNYSNVTGNGWHRIGLRYHQTAALDGETVVYTFTYTLYVDGVKINEVQTAPSRFVGNNYLLYTATNDEGKLKYSDGSSSRYFHWIQMQSFYNAGSDRCVAFADLMMNSGHDFVQQVEKLNTPAAAPFDLGSWDPAVMYYKLAD